jgi:hypothetical protein
VSDGYGGKTSQSVTVPVAPMGPALGALAKIWSSDPALGQLPTDTIYAEKIQSASDGKYRMVVYMSGVDTPAIDQLISALAKTTVKTVLQRVNPLAGLVANAALPLTKDEIAAVNTFLTSSVPGLASNTGLLRTDVQDYINAAYNKFTANGAQIVEVQLVGHSNGGQQLQAYASAGTYRGQVTSLVVFGSPLIKKTDELGDKSQKGWETKLKAIAFRNNADIVPWVSDVLRAAGIRSVSNPLGIPGLDAVRWDRNGKTEFRFGPTNIGVGFDNHHAFKYRDYAAQFDASTTYSEQRTVMQRFIGTVVDKTDKKKVDGFSPPVILIPGL